MDSARLALMVKLAPPIKRAVRIVLVDLYEAALMARCFQIVLLPQALAQVPGRSPSMEPARLALMAKSALPIKRTVPIVQTDKCAVMQRDHNLHHVKAPRLFAQASGSMHNTESARIVLTAKTPTPRKQTVSTVQMEVFVAIIPESLLKRAQVFAKNGSMPNMEHARIAQQAKLVTLAISAASIVPVDL
jgi:hypothetical protein